MTFMTDGPPKCRVTETFYIFCSGGFLPQGAKYERVDRIGTKQWALHTYRGSVTYV
jgi:hypothetical protein